MKKVILTFIFLLTIAFNSFSQCAMCGEVAKNSGGGESLNDGILYLMFIPYVLLGAFVFFILRKKIISFYREFFRKDKDEKELNAETWY